jgi:hypothetical protein
LSCEYADSGKGFSLDCGSVTPGNSREEPDLEDGFNGGLPRTYIPAVFIFGDTEQALSQLVYSS